MLNIFHIRFLYENLIHMWCINWSMASMGNLIEDLIHCGDSK